MSLFFLLAILIFSKIGPSIFLNSMCLVIISNCEPFKIVVVCDILKKKSKFWITVDWRLATSFYLIIDIDKLYKTSFDFSQSPKQGLS